MSFINLITYMYRNIKHLHIQIDKMNLGMIHQDENSLIDLYNNVKTLQEKYKFKILDYNKDDCLSQMDKIEFTMFKKFDSSIGALNITENSKWFNSLPSIIETDIQSQNNLDQAQSEDFFKAFGQPLQSACNIPKKIGGKSIFLAFIKVANF